MKEINEYWRKNKSRLIRKAKNANPDWEETEPEKGETVNKAFSKYVKQVFEDNVSAYMDQGYDFMEAVHKEVRSRDFTSSANFYAEGVMDKLKTYYKDEISYSNGRYRNSKGQFISDPTTQIKYLDSIYFQDQSWVGYSFVNKAGVTKYFYETGSPKGGTYTTMVLDKALN